MSEQPWYGDGLQFRCTQCGNCCTGGPGAVWVTDDDLRRIAEHTGKSLGEVRLFHTRLIGSRVSLQEYANGDCTFFDGAARRCTVYPVRPSQCRTWPFWAGNIESSEAWAKTQSVCPGAGRGDFVPADEIRRRVAEAGT
jgi:uncharacterized protein